MRCAGGLAAGAAARAGHARPLGARSAGDRPMVQRAESCSAGIPWKVGGSIVIKVLYIEDNEDDVYMLKMRLELLGEFEVLAARDGEKGCEMAARERPDIILMDLEMPIING